jgi:hypothetical protein
VGIIINHGTVMLLFGILLDNITMSEFCSYLLPSQLRHDYIANFALYIVSSGYYVD